MKIDVTAVAGAGLPDGADAVELNLFPDNKFEAVKSRFQRRDDTHFTWFGKVADDPQSTVVLLGSAGRMRGLVFAHGKHFSIRGADAASQEIVEIDQSAFPRELCDESPAGDAAPSAPALPASPDAPPDSGSTIDVLVVFTAAAQSAAGGEAAMLAVAQDAVDFTNASYGNSVVTPRLNLVHAAQVGYTESGNWNTDLSRLSGTGDGFMDIVHTLRDTHRADVVVLLTNDQTSCGIAYIAATATSAFAVVAWDCAVDYYSFAHEVGHLQGARHDRYVDSVNGPNYTYNHGDVDLSLRKRTIMAYNSQCADTYPNTYCDRLGYWSNPDVPYPGSARSTGSVTYENNAKVLNNTAYTVANFRHEVEVTVQSTYPAAGVSITASPADNLGASGGTTGFALTYNQNTSVTLTAPLTNPSGFSLLNWSGCTTTSGPNCTVVLSGNKTVTVNYATENYLPTLNAISNRTINEDAGLQTVVLSGISAGPGELGQTPVVSASSSNPALIPDPTVIHSGVNTVGSLIFTPAANASGTATITVTVDDGQASNNTFSRDFDVTVNAVNDAPSFVKGADQTEFEGPGAREVAGWATDISAGPASENGQALFFTATSNRRRLFSVQPAVAADGTLSFTPAANKSGSATVTVRLHDSGGTANGGVDTSGAQTFTITVNDPPTLNAIGDVTIDEDAGRRRIALSGISAGGGGSQTLKVTAVSSNPALIPNPAVSYQSPRTTGRLSFRPKADASGTATITVTVDDGQRGNNTVERSFDVTVNPVNDTPTLKAIPNLTIGEDAAVQTVNLSRISAGGGESQPLAVSAVSSNHALIPDPTVSYTSPAAGGSLSFLPVPDAYGTAIITVVVGDGQATNNSRSRRFVVTVNPVNDAPSFVKGPDQAVLENAGLQTVSGWATSVSAGPFNESGQRLRFLTTNNNTGLFRVQPAVTPGGALAFQSAANKSGLATVTVRLRDSGGTAYGGENVSDAQTFKITVTAMSELPASDLPVAAGGDAGLSASFVGVSDGLDPGNPSGPAPLAVTFDAGGSTGPNPIVSYHWDFGDHRSADTATPTVAHRYDATGSYLATLTVGDSSGGTDATQLLVSVAEVVQTATTAAELQTALDAAGVNGKHDVIRIAGGDYALSALAGERFTYASAEEQDLVIEGGWTPDFRQRADNVTTEIRNDLPVTLTGSGGVLEVTAGGNVSLSGVVISGGRAAGGGGGVWITAAGTVVVGNSRILDNASGGEGGGLFVESTGADVRVYGSTIRGNRGVGGGGGCLRGRSVTVYGNEISGNAAEATDGGLQASVHSGGSLIVSNNTIYGNQAPAGSSGLSVAATGARGMSVLDIHNNIVYGNAAAPDFVVAPDGDCLLNYLDLNITNNDIACYEMCPEYLLDGSNSGVDFSGRAAGSIRLSAADVALIDQGAPNTIPFEDIEGDAIPLAGTEGASPAPDIGADEYNPENITGPAVLSVTASGSITAADVGATITVGLDAPAKRDFVVYLTVGDEGLLTLSTPYLRILKGTSSAQTLVRAASGATSGVATIAAADPSGRVAPGSALVSVDVPE